MTTAIKKKSPTGRAKKILIIIFFAIIALALIGMLALHLFLSQGLPQIEGKLKLSMLDAPVIVTRDEEGVPHIKGETLRDLYIAQGFVEAQDRMFQMDLSRRQASGRLAEVFGGTAVEQDKMFRTLGLRRAAVLSEAEYSEEARDVLGWFCEGVNAYIEKGDLPPEFALNGYKPEPWTPVDCLTIAKYMAHDLGGHWESQAFRQYLLETFPEAEALELFPGYPEGAPLIIGSEISLLPGFIAAADDTANVWNGSNDWVVSGEKSASGMPILSDDPHLSIATPSIWYQVHLQCADLDVSGVIFGGIPGVILGHNRDIAWGVTNTGPDVQDLFLEKQNPDNPLEFEYMGQWEKATVHQEDILVKGGTVVPFQVLETRHGPIISDLAKANPDDAPLYALQWTALRPTHELDAVLNMNRAKNWEEFEKALEDFQAPTQNFVFADKSGTIAYKANGLIPIRAEGDGLLPVPGWDGAHEWVGFIPFDELPTVVNPSAGFIATANNKVVGDDYPYHISHIFAQPYRQQRIVEVLSGKDNLTAEDMRLLQADTLDLHARELAPLMISALQDAALTDRQKSALAIVDAWDYDTVETAAGPLVFNLWYGEIGPGLFNERIPSEALGLFEGKNLVTDDMIRATCSGESRIWVDKAGGIQTLLLSALDRALDTIEKAQGKDMKAWQWGKYHQVGFVHPLSRVGMLAPLFNPKGRTASPGGPTTVRAASYRGSDGLNNHGSTWRFVIDLATEGEAFQIVAPGESGHPKSPYYQGQIERWIRGQQYLTKTEGYEGKVLTLEP